ncbi:MAG: PAS domain-containing protein [Acidobacteriota bacterium]|nr:PAS domain-containing protein [Acidobacteriota bacterium]
MLEREPPVRTEHSSGTQAVSPGAVLDAEVVPSETSLIRLLQELPDAMMCLNREWRITYANGEARRLSRVAADDLRGKTHWELYPGTVGSELERRFRRVMESGQPDRIEYFYEPFGVWADIRIFGTDDGIGLYYRDITEHRRATQQRDRFARQLEQVFQATTDAIVALDRSWNFTYVNDRAREILSAKGELIGRCLWDEFPAMQNSIYERRYREAMAEQVGVEFEAFYPEPLNAWFWVEARPSDEGIVVFFRDITQRKQREHELHEQQELLEEIQGAALAATWELDVCSGRLTFGPGSYPVFGRPLEELTSVDAVRAFLYPPDEDRVAEAVREALGGERVVVVEFRVLVPDGRRLWIESRATAVTDAGTVTHLRGMSIDISERKKNEEALVASEGRYRVLADLNPQAIWMGAPDGSVLYANQGLLDYMGQTIAGLCGLGWLQGYYPADRERVLERWGRSVLTGEEYDVECRLVRATDGAVRWWSIRARPVLDNTGAILYWLGVGTDIHDSRTAAESLRQKQAETERQRAELETVYQTAPVGLALFDAAEFRCLRLNERQAGILGLTEEQVLGRTLAEIAPMPGLEEMFRGAAAGHPARNQVFEGVLSTRPGEHRVWNVSVMPVYSKAAGAEGDASIQAITSAWLEITHLKRAESALVQSEKLAAVGRLASSISHEINNPLEAITNLLYLIAQHEQLPGELKLFVHMAQSELARVSQIATQTLRFHRQAVNPTLVTPAELIDAVVNLYNGRLVNSGIEVRSHYLTQTRVWCFENDIRQVLNNLIANAIDAMRGGGRLLVRAHDATHHPSGRRGVRLTIADTGHGMSRSVQHRIFEPFFTTKDLNGTGLGLWISEGIVQRHHAKLSLRSAQGPDRHGTVFTLFLPCADEEQPQKLAS